MFFMSLIFIFFTLICSINGMKLCRTFKMNNLKPLATITAAASLLILHPTEIYASSSSTILSSGENMIYKSGKNPKGPNKDGDKTGTKKDYKFLKCMSGCKADCQSPSSGLATQRNDCVQDCQDQCCDTYEQCSYKIKMGSDTGMN